jgi:hypothetical protein
MIYLTKKVFFGCWWKMGKCHDQYGNIIEFISTVHSDDHVTKNLKCYGRYNIPRYCIKLTKDFPCPFQCGKRIDDFHIDSYESETGHP